MAKLSNRDFRQAIAREKLLGKVNYDYDFNSFHIDYIIHFCRLKLAAFFSGNGLSTENAEQILIHYNQGLFTRDDDKKLKKILCVMRYVLKEENKSRYFFYSMRFGAVFYFNNERKIKV